MRRLLGLIVVPAILSFTGCRAPGVGSIDVDVLPAAVVLAPGGLQTFTATVTGSPDGSVTWTASCGEIVATATGATYTAPAAVGTCSVTATSAADPTATGSASVTIDVAPAGHAVWLRQYAPVGGARVGAAAVDVGPDGRVAVAGYAQGDFGGVAVGGTDAFVLALDANGAELWRRQFGSASGDWATGLATGPGGRTLVTGTSTGASAGMGEGQVFLAAFEVGGELAWFRRIAETAEDHAVGVAVDPEGRAFVVWYASSHLGSGVPRAYLSKFDLAGTELWRRPFADDVPLPALAVAGDGGVTVVAHAPAGVVVVAFDAAGLETGRRVHAVDDHVEAVALTADGRSWIAGSTLRAPEGGGLLSDFEAYLEAHDAAGDLLWRRQFSSDGTGAWPTDATFAADGGPVVVGGALGTLEPSAAGPVPVFLGFRDELDREMFVMKLAP